jgi:uncharacterized protein YdcH (DUF465 family)
MELEDLEGLRKRHLALEQRLADLGRHVSLTPAEQNERARLKKEKLWLKDRIQALTEHP